MVKTLEENVMLKVCCSVWCCEEIFEWVQLSVQCVCLAIRKSSCGLSWECETHSCDQCDAVVLRSAPILAPHDFKLGGAATFPSTSLQLWCLSVHWRSSGWGRLSRNCPADLFPTTERFYLMTQSRITCKIRYYAQTHIIWYVSAGLNGLPGWCCVGPCRLHIA